MALFGKQLNIIIGFDTVNYNLRVMKMVGTDPATATVDYIPVDSSFFIKGDYAAIISHALPDYIKQQNFDRSFAVWLVLPDRLIGTDLLTVPTLTNSKMAAAVQTKLEDLYRFYQNFKFNRHQVSANKTSSTFQLYMLNKTILNSVYKALNDCKLYVKNATYSASSSVNACLNLLPKFRRSSFIFLDVKQDVTKFSVCQKGVTIGYKSLPFGTNAFSTDKVLVEGNLYNNDLAEIAVINATERARQRKMTVLDDDADLIEDAALTVHDLDVNESLNENLERSIVEGEIDVMANGVPNSSQEGDLQNANEAEKAAENENSAAAQTAAPAEPPKPKVKAYVRKQKRLPVFMQRPTPETPEGFVYENFRIFLKHSLMIKQFNEQSGFFAPPQNVIVNMPSQYSYLYDMVNEEQQDLNFSPLFKEDVNPFAATNIDLYGAVFMNLFNKVNNF